MANSYLFRNFTSAGNKKTFTFSAWVKFADATSISTLFATGADSENRLIFIRHDSGSGSALKVDGKTSTNQTIEVRTNRAFRDTNAWYHIVLRVDTTQSTASDRVRIYVNGVQETSFAQSTYPSQNYDTEVNKTANHMVGRYSYSASNYMNGYMSHVAFVDGASLAPTSFGQTDSTSGIWKFKSPSGITWGTNGFHLKFENSGNLGLDSSSNTANWTSQGDLKQSIDTPSIVYPTWNISASPGGTLSNGNLSNTSAHDTPATFGVTKGKWYWEYKRTNSTNSLHYGICSTTKGFNKTTSQMLNGESNSVGAAIYIYESGTGSTGYGNAGAFSSVNYGSVSTPSIANGDIVGCALDISSASGTLTFYKNGSSMGAATFTYDQVTPVYPFIRMNSNATSDVNFGTGLFGTTAIASAGSNGNGSLFEYDVPSNHYALNTTNINTYG